jgi:hypothetical protein
VLPDPGYQVKFLKPNGELHFQSNPGPQTWVLNCRYDEILLGGRRGGGKSKILIAFMAMGDPSLPPDDLARSSFLNDPSYRGLLLREEYQSMAEFVEEAVEFFKPFGGKPAGNPVAIDFPKTGAKIYFNHLGDESAFNKYKGWNLTRIGIEELTQISTLRRYLKLLGSLRSVERVRGKKRFPALRTQIVSTTNPDGPGLWVKDRFVDVRDGRGELIPWNTPMRDPISGLKRIFIPFGLEANPYLAEDTPAGRRYRSMLLSQDEVTRKQWMEGDWNAGGSRFFMSYRPDGPIGIEENEKFPWARHRVKSDAVKLEPWYIKWGGGDWGYSHKAAFHKLCRNERDKRVHVYDEFTTRQVGSFELGAQLATWWMADLEQMQAAGKDPCVTIYMGADVFSKTDVTKTKAEQMALGIQQVLGPYGAILLKYNEDEKSAQERDRASALRMFERRKAELLGHIRIALKPIYIDRVGAWGYMRDMLRFRPAVLNLQTAEERNQYLKDVLKTKGIEAYEMAAADLQKAKPEVLPRLQIWDRCPELDRCLKVAQHDTRSDDNPHSISKREDVLKFNADENGEGGDDALESARNGIAAFKEIEASIPESYWVGTRIEEIQDQHAQDFGDKITDPTRLAMIAARQSVIFNQQVQPSGGGVFTLPRQSSMRHRVQ